MKRNLVVEGASLGFKEVIFTLLYFLTRLVLRVIFGKHRRNRFLLTRYGNCADMEYIKLMLTPFPKRIRYYLATRVIFLRPQSQFFFESEIKKIIQSYRGELFIDIGANIGIHTVTASKCFNRVLAIEPHPINVRKMNARLKKRKITNVTIHEVAITNYTGLGRLHISTNPGGHSLRDETGEGTILVRVSRLQDLITDEKQFDLIKVDVEGAEWDVLRGAILIMPKIQGWIIELHNTNKRRELISLMRSFGYNTRWLDYYHLYAKRGNLT